ncbi:unnamed protein product [Blepharisma stoltei]|uniref:DUF5050 domain-containing protein n=1 Tax=Blepharisma stoltei TaxID=1481888 RepID=A0AAU9IH89_9CILI|nr:unnamed protein product [Blepharisma stoltei]
MSWRYKISEGRWYKLASNYDAWSAGQVGPLFKNYVFLWSLVTNKVYIYDIDIDSFSNLSIPSITQCKLFIIGSENIYAISNEEYLYENNGDLSDWKILGKLYVRGCSFEMKSSPIYYEEKVYYANWSGIFRFNLKKKKLKNVIYFNKLAEE